MSDRAPSSTAYDSAHTETTMSAATIFRPCQGGSKTVSDDVYFGAVGLATQSIVTRLLRSLVEKKVIPSAEVTSMLEASKASLEEYGTDAAIGAAEIVGIIAELLQKPAD